MFQPLPRLTRKQTKAQNAPQKPQGFFIAHSLSGQLELPLEGSRFSRARFPQYAGRARLPRFECIQGEVDAVNILITTRFKKTSQEFDFDVIIEFYMAPYINIIGIISTYI